MTQEKWVYFFGDGKAEGSSAMKNLLGGKGANLAEMSSIGLPVPPGLTITTEVCNYFYANKRTYPKNLELQVKENIRHIEQLVSTKFGDGSNPLLLSVRSGARSSMPGMMDTILNLGLNDKTVLGLAKKSNNERFAFDSYRRFIQMYSDVVLGVEKHLFEEILDYKKQDKGVYDDVSLDAEDLKEIVGLYLEKVIEETGKPFPQDVEEQLWNAISAVFKSWMNDRAITYRKMYDIPAQWGTAVNVQAMVFGNMGDASATGVAFTRDPSTGEKIFYGEYLINAQGEDVVAGIRTPQQISIEGRKKQGSDLPSMEETMPEVYKELLRIQKILENHYRDMQDIEFTVQNKKLWMLQTRNGKRTAKSAVKVAIDMVNEGLISKKEAILRVEPSSLDQLLHPSLDKNAKKILLAKGLPASPGAVSGKVVFSAHDAQELASRGEDVILVRTETSPEDINGMSVARGILTARGGMTSHAAVVARGMGRACVSGASTIEINYHKKELRAGSKIIKENEIITIDGGSGEVFEGKVPTISPELGNDFATLMRWADEFRQLKVRCNSETLEDAKVAREFGAEGIGLCRTEHMFFNENRINVVREVIIAENEEIRNRAIAKLLPFQRKDFVEIFTVMDGLPVNIRLLDPPLHEFLPENEKDVLEISKTTGISVEKIHRKIEGLKEVNPMLGHRGCRLGITYPELYKMQVQAIMEAACEVAKKGFKAIPEIMIPIVMNKKELEILRSQTEAVAKEVIAKSGVKIDYQIGTMIELPRAALQAGEIASFADFFSFGTNDLTQTTLGISRDDSANFINEYIAKGIVAKDPFATLDIEGVGELIKIAVERGRKVKPTLKLGICGEHGGDPASIEFFHKVGLNYVSCSPYRVPIARLASARAGLVD
ncbi:MAG: pyruvate, phosphate dikinase [Alphaproteobacteria bacterium]